MYATFMELENLKPINYAIHTDTPITKEKQNFHKPLTMHGKIICLKHINDMTASKNCKYEITLKERDSP